jgi:hypothetical protein
MFRLYGLASSFAKFGSCLGLFQADRWKLVVVYILCVVPVVYLALLLGFGRTTPPTAQSDDTQGPT